MDLPQGTFEQLSKDYLVTVDGKDLIVIGREGTIIASSNPERVGQSYQAKHAVSQKAGGKDTSPTDVSEEPLADKELEQKYENLIKNLTKAFANENIESASPAINSTDQFVRHLINAPNMESSFIAAMESEAKLIGYDLSVKRSAIIISFDGFFQNYLLECPQPTYERDKAINDWKQKIENTMATFFTKNKDMITAYLGENRFVVFKALGDSTEDKFVRVMKSAFSSIFGPLKNHHISDIQVGFGKAAEGVNGLYNSFKEAEFALELGQVFLQRSKCYYFGDLGILYILADGDRHKKIQFANQLLSNLHSDELVKTLEVFFNNNLNISDTADHLGIHRNTVIYRLDRLADYLNLDPRNFADAVAIKIALILKKISAMNQLNPSE